MTLFDLALKNVRRNLKSYSLYIGSTIFSMIIYFTFVTLKYSEDMTALSETSNTIRGILSGSAFVLIIFVTIFIVYSNSFFMKRRKKEVALYSLLGVRKRSIGLMLFFENMAIGLFSLIFGVVLGLLFSSGLLAILMKLMGLNFVIEFVFSMDALINTVIVFSLIFLFTSIQGYRVIYQFKLIDLFQAEKKGEKLPKARFIAALLGVVALVAAYWLALQDLMTSSIWRMFGLSTPLVIIGLVVIGSFLLFNSVLVYLLSRMKKSKRWAWKGLNLMTSSQLLYRMKGNARTLTIIAILSATTITAGGAVFGLYYNVDKAIQAHAPYTFMWEGDPKDIDPSLIELAETIHIKSIRTTQDAIEMEYAVMNQSAFEKLAKNLGWPDIQATKEGEVLLIDAFYDESKSPKIESVMIDGETYTVAKLYDKALFNTFTVGGSSLVVTDQLYDEITDHEKVFQAVKVKDYKNQMALSKELAANTRNFTSATEEYRAYIEQLGALLFVGSFLGLVFLVATGSIIFFKVMTEAEEDRDKYAVLYKIGVSKREMKRTIRSQVGLIFAAPLVLGLLHGAVALIAFSNIFSMDLLVPVIIWMLAYTFIYIIYYFITVRSFNKVVYVK